MAELRAVITGDFIGSRDATPEDLESAMRIVADQAGHLSEQNQANTHFTRFRGDGWQIYLAIPGLCLSAALQIVAALRARGPGLVTRQSIGLGRVSHLPDNDLSTARGDAFEASGLMLEHIARPRRMAISGDQDVIMPWREAIVALADWHSARWTPQQAEAMELYLRHGRGEGTIQAELAARLGITRQAFQARLSGAGHWAWDDALATFESQTESADA